MAGPWNTPPTEDEVKASAAFDSPPTPEEMAGAGPSSEPPKLGFADKAINMLGRAGWAIPGLVGLDHETVQSAVTGTPREEFYKQSKQVDTEHPVASPVVRGVLQTPAEALLWMGAPGGKAASTLRPVVQGAKELGQFAKNFLTYGPRAGVLAGASEYGQTGYKPTGDRLRDAFFTGAGATLVGGSMAGVLPFPQALAPMTKVGDVSELERALAQAEGHSAAASRAASGATAAAAGGDAAAANQTTVVIRPSKLEKVMPEGLRTPEPTPEAQYLLDRGVPLTRGQYDSRSAAAASEIASQSLQHSGAGIRTQRHAALDKATDLGFQVARPPGAEPLPVGFARGVNEKFQLLDSAWDNEYAAAKEALGEVLPAIVENPSVRAARQAEVAQRAAAETAQVDDALRALEESVAVERKRLQGAVRLDPEAAVRQAETLKGLGNQRIDLLQKKEAVTRAAQVAASEDRTVALADAINAAISDPRLMAGDEATAIVRRFVADELSRLRSAHGERIPAAALLDLRSEIRTRAREMLRGRRDQEFKLLRAAERQFSEVIYSQADPAAVARLKDLDANYFNYKVVEEAVIRAGDAPGGFSPATFSSALRSVMADRHEYALGGGGEMRTVAKAIRDVFDESIAPPTGARMLTVGPQWWKEALGQTIYLRNNSAAKATGGAASAEAIAASRAAARARQAVNAATTSSQGPAGAFFSRNPIPLPRYASPAPASQASLQTLAEFLRRYGLGPAGAGAEEDAP